jgi:hemerythrin-like domain-containing protein
MDAAQMIRQDHRRVKDLFRQFEQARDSRSKKRIVENAIRELEIHTKLEEEIFYPAVRGQGDAEGMIEDAEQEHHVVDLLIEELRGMDADDDEFDAKFTVMAENVKHHIDEEETEMLPKAAEEGFERLERLGEEMARRKQELLAEMDAPQRRARRATAASRARASGNGRSAAAAVRRRTSTATRKATKGAGRARKTAARGAKSAATKARSTTSRARSAAGGRRAKAKAGSR